jgi:hypothetical protein
MTREQPMEEPALDCPLLRPVAADYLWMYPTGVYCRHPSGRIRVPSRDTVAWVCTDGHYFNCPNYRRWRHEEAESLG